MPQFKILNISASDGLLYVVYQSSVTQPAQLYISNDLGQTLTTKPNFTTPFVKGMDDRAGAMKLQSLNYNVCVGGEIEGVYAMNIKENQSSWQPLFKEDDKDLIGTMRADSDNNTLAFVSGQLSTSPHDYLYVSNYDGKNWAVPPNKYLLHMVEGGQDFCAIAGINNKFVAFLAIKNRGAYFISTANLTADPARLHTYNYTMSDISNGKDLGGFAQIYLANTTPLPTVFAICTKGISVGTFAADGSIASWQSHINLSNYALYPFRPRDEDGSTYYGGPGYASMTYYDSSSQMLYVLGEYEFPRLLGYDRNFNYKPTNTLSASPHDLGSLMTFTYDKSSGALYMFFIDSLKDGGETVVVSTDLGNSWQTCSLKIV